MFMDVFRAPTTLLEVSDAHRARLGCLPSPHSCDHMDPKVFFIIIYLT